MKISVTELRPKLTNVLEQVKAGETVDIEQRGVIVARIVPPIEFEQTTVLPLQKGGLKREAYYPTLEEVQRRDKETRNLLRGVNRKS